MSGYDPLTAQMRAGDDPGAVFDQLVQAGRVVVHASTTGALDTLAASASGGRDGTAHTAVVAATRRNDHDLDVANRDAWHVVGVDTRGVWVTRGDAHKHAGDETRLLPTAYVREHRAPTPGGVTAFRPVVQAETAIIGRVASAELHPARLRAGDSQCTPAATGRVTKPQRIPGTCARPRVSERLS